MCGINGMLRLTPDAPALDPGELVATRDAMAARGPDGAGLWMSPDGRIGFGHRRLAVIDLSPAGAQPMHSDDGRHTLVFNGEIYNHRELRAELERDGACFRSSSDTEVLLRLYARDELRMFERLEGMYALALWDAPRERLLLARDPFGIKPLYFAEGGGTLRFASQVKALEAGGAVPQALDQAALVGFLLWGSVPEPLTLRRAVRAVPAGHVLEVRRGGVAAPRPIPSPSPPGPSDDPLRTVAAALEQSVRAHLVSDVPVGVFLSAGLDSALITALVRRVRREPPATFTVTFDDLAGGPLDEGPGAAAVATRLGTHHAEHRVPHAVLDELWPSALRAMDQPSIDGFNVFVVSHFARQAGFKVVLSGLGGDELFGGYPSFHDVPRWTRWARLAALVPGLAAAWPALARTVRARVPKLAGLVRYGTHIEGAYFLRRGLFLPEELPQVLGRERAADGLAAYDPLADAVGVLGREPHADPWRAVHSLETGVYMRNQLLRDADWASMAHGLELRVPLVSARLSQVLAAVDHEPARGAGKAALVRSVAPELPPALFARRKSGFMMPALPDGLAHSHWGARSRLRAVRVLRHFGVDVPLPEDARGGTLFLMTEAFASPGGIQRCNRAQVQAFKSCRPDEPLRALVLNDTEDDVRQPEWHGLRAEGCARRRARFAWRSVRSAWRQQPARILVGHRHFLPLLPLLALAAPGAPRWLLSYGLELERPFGTLERRLLRAVTRAFAISPYTAGRLEHAGYTGAVELWPCCLPFDYALPAAAPPQFAPPVRLLSVARLDAAERYKGVDHTIAALRRLRDAGIDVRLDVAGDGSDRARLERLTASAELAPHVCFHGHVSDAALAALYAGCDIFVLPSGGEGFGLVYLEAFAHAKPAVAADAGGAPFVVQREHGGTLVPYGSVEALAAAIAGLISHPERSRRAALAARARVEREFTFASLCRRTRDLLDTVPYGRGGTG